MTGSAQLCRSCENQPDGAGRWPVAGGSSTTSQVTAERFSRGGCDS